MPTIIISNKKIAEFAEEHYVMCASVGSSDAAKQQERMETTLSVTHSFYHGMLKITIRHPTLHNRVFHCSLDVNDADDADVATNTLVPDDEKDAFQEGFMTDIINYIQEGEDE